MSPPWKANLMTAHTAVIVVLALLSVAPFVHADDQEDSLEVDCGHGHAVHGEVANQKRCECEDGWQTAGITDTIHFLQGTCRQFMCEGDDICEAGLGIKGATCPVHHWNCYCGWRYAFSNDFTGWESENGKGKCMGVMYTFAFWASDVLDFLLQHLWRFFTALAFLLLPFGRKRGICDHHRPTLWNALRRAFGCQSMCRGECVLSAEYTVSSFQDDFAWTIYALDLMVWTYLFCTALYIIVLLIWAFMLWTLVILILIAACIAAACGVLFSGGGDCAGGADCTCGECGACECGACECGGAADCCFFGGGGIGHASPVEADVFYLGGPYPFDPLWGYGGTPYDPFIGTNGGGNCSCCSCRTICCPIAWLFYVFPSLPENAWGGFLGLYVLGTHQRTPADSLYSGGNQITEFLRMSWRRPGDLHGESEWRERVYHFIMGPEDSITSYDVPDRERADENVGTLYIDGGTPKKVISIGRSKAVLIERSFDQVHDRCYESSFSDYKKGTCWICQDQKTDWDMWLSCRHLFCTHCSTQMLMRRMPCPLCRVASATVLRGYRYTPPPGPDEEQPFLGMTTTTSSSYDPGTVSPVSTIGVDQPRPAQPPHTPSSASQEGPSTALLPSSTTPMPQPVRTTPRTSEQPIFPTDPPLRPAPAHRPDQRPQHQPPVVSPREPPSRQLPAQDSPTQTQWQEQQPPLLPVAHPSQSPAVVRPWHVGAHCIVGVKADDPGWQCQDSYCVLPMGGGRVLVGVFDGHGPKENGRLAAEMARHIFEREGAAYSASPLSDSAVAALLVSMFELTHRELQKHQQHFLYAGTTATAAIVNEVTGVVNMAFVGDSRLIVVDADGQLVFRTMDHVIDDAAAQRVEACGGEVRIRTISGISARRVYERGTQFPGIMMSRSLGDFAAHAIGLQHTPEVHMGIPFPPGSSLVLATDGVWEHVREAEAAMFCRQELGRGVAPCDISKKLVEISRARWPPLYSDDISALVVAATPAGSAPSGSIKPQLGSARLWGCTTSTAGSLLLPRQHIPLPRDHLQVAAAAPEEALAAEAHAAVKCEGAAGTAALNAEALAAEATAPVEAPAADKRDAETRQAADGIVDLTAEAPAAAEAPVAEKCVAETSPAACTVEAPRAEASAAEECVAETCQAALTLEVEATALSAAPAAEACAVEKSQAADFVATLAVEEETRHGSDAQKQPDLLGDLDIVSPSCVAKQESAESANYAGARLHRHRIVSLPGSKRLKEFSVSTAGMQWVRAE